MAKERICPICKKWFIPNKYRPNQTICSNLECQYQRQLDNMKKWRNGNPNYFRYREAKDETWKETCKDRAKRWRERHQEYLKLYRQEHKDRYRIYMRQYMQDYRKKKKQDQQQEKEKGILPGEPKSPETKIEGKEA